MSWLRYIRRGRWDAERRRELQAYVELETDDNIARSCHPETGQSHIGA